jgi:predicted NAD-dependent protein-ADP-ribosyltransferase YbiA (DUF1768 family)
VYPENRLLENDDKDYMATQYEMQILGENIIIALGKSKYSFADKNIEYFPIYLINKDKVHMQIGVYEALSSDLPNLVDADGDLNLELFGYPLLHSFIMESPELLKIISKAHKTTSKQKLKVNTLGLLPEQTQEIAERERTEFKQSTAVEWIQKYMKNNNYNIVDNIGNGDCFFNVISDGFARAGKTFTVEQLRQILSDNADEKVFNEYHTLYIDTRTEYDNINDKMKSLNDENKQLKQKLTEIKDKKEQVQIVARGKEIKAEYEKLKEQKEIASNLYNEFKFMKGIKKLNKFRELIKTREYWADTWAISTLERILNIKIILLSEEYYAQGDLSNVIQCGQLNDSVLQARGVFNPEHYIITSYTGNHYKLVIYKSRGALTYSELPYDIKQLIVGKCLESKQGPYNLIPEFKKLKNLSKSSASTSVEGTETVEEEESEDIDVIQLPSDDLLWNEDTVFQFYEKSASKPLPGKGTGEKIGEEGVKAYTELHKIPDWRRKLSNLWMSPFELDKHTWNSVEHYYQASKFKNDHPEFYLQFTIGSYSEISQDPELAEAAGSKQGKLGTKLLRPKYIEFDTNFEERSDAEMKKAINAKFTQNNEMKVLLLNTKMAKLQQYQRGTPAITMKTLMEVRKSLSK